MRIPRSFGDIALVIIERFRRGGTTVRQEQVLQVGRIAHNLDRIADVMEAGASDAAIAKLTAQAKRLQEKLADSSEALGAATEANEPT